MVEGKECRIYHRVYPFQVLQGQESKAEISSIQGVLFRHLVHLRVALSQLVGLLLHPFESGAQP